MSALPPKADMDQQGCDVRFVPKADIAPAARLTLFDHLIGASEQRWRHGETEHPGRLGVDHQLELGRLHHRQVRRLRALEYATGIDAHLTIRVTIFGP